MAERLVLLVLVGCSDVDEGGPYRDSTYARELPDACGPLPAGGGDEVGDLAAAVADAGPGDTLLLADGTWSLDEAVEIGVDGLTIRSASGDASAVVIDGGYAASALFTVRAADFTLAEVTLQHSYDAAVEVLGARGTWLWGVRVVDPQGYGVSAEAWQGEYADDGVVACSTFTRTETCSGAIDARQAAGWTVRGNGVEQGACDATGIRFWTGSRDTLVERNVVATQGEGIALGDTDYEADEPRVHDHACAGGDQMGHYGGVVRDNLVAGAIRLEEACGATVLHDTATGGLSWTSGEALVVRNNLAAVDDAGGATVEGNLAPGDADFVSATDLHLAAGSAAIDAGVPNQPGDADTDVDGDPRDDGAPDVGADEAG